MKVSLISREATPVSSFAIRLATMVAAGCSKSLSMPLSLMSKCKCTDLHRSSLERGAHLMHRHGASVSRSPLMVEHQTVVVFEDEAQSLSNKELVNPLIKLGANHGSIGQVLTSRGAGLAPEYRTPVTSENQLLATFSAAGVSMITMDTQFGSGFEDYAVVIDDLKNTARTFGVFMQIKMGGAWLTTGYGTIAAMYLAETASSYPLVDSPGNAFKINPGPSDPMINEIGLSPYAMFDARVILHKAERVRWPRVSFDTVFYGGSSTDKHPRRVMGHSSHSVAGAVQGVRLYPGSGSWSGGTVRLYGCRAV